MKWAIAGKKRAFVAGMKWAIAGSKRAFVAGMKWTVAGSKGAFVAGSTGKWAIVICKWAFCVWK